MSINPSKTIKTVKHPVWLVKHTTLDPNVYWMEEILDQLKLATVCQSACCPNMGECFGRGTATFMILGTKCTRNCGYCAVTKGEPQEVDVREPKRIAHAAKILNLRHIVITSVTRDDLSDGGSHHFAQTIECIRKQGKEITIEVLIPDFKGSLSALQEVCAAYPNILNHNLETVPRLYEWVRPKAIYSRSLGIIEYASRSGMVVKSGLMLGLGETREEVIKTISDLKEAGCHYLTLGQYLAPSKNHISVARYLSPEEFSELERIAQLIGIKKVIAGPFVRSSYKADSLLDSCI